MQLACPRFKGSTVHQNGPLHKNHHLSPHNLRSGDTCLPDSLLNAWPLFRGSTLLLVLCVVQPLETLEQEMLDGQKLQGPLTAKEVHDVLSQDGRTDE